MSNFRVEQKAEWLIRSRKLTIAKLCTRIIKNRVLIQINILPKQNEIELINIEGKHNVIELYV